MTDNYEYERSMHPQSEGEYSPYTDKQYNLYINDINSGVYTNNGLSLVQFDLSSIYNSSRFTDCNDLFVVLPSLSRERPNPRPGFLTNSILKGNIA